MSTTEDVVTKPTLRSRLKEPGEERIISSIKLKQLVKKIEGITGDKADRMITLIPEPLAVLVFNGHYASIKGSDVEFELRYLNKFSLWKYYLVKKDEPAVFATGEDLKGLRSPEWSRRAGLVKCQIIRDNIATTFVPNYVATMKRLTGKKRRLGSDTEIPTESACLTTLLPHTVPPGPTEEFGKLSTQTTAPFPLPPAPLTPTPVSVAVRTETPFPLPPAPLTPTTVAVRTPTPSPVATVTVGLEAEVLVSYSGGVLKISRGGELIDVEPYMQRFLPDFRREHRGDYYDMLLLTTKDGLINISVEHIDEKYTIEFTTEPSEDSDGALSYRLQGMLQSLQDCIDRMTHGMTSVRLWSWAAEYNATLPMEKHKFLLPTEFETIHSTTYLEADAEPILQVVPGSKLLYAFHINATIPLELLYSERMLDLFPVQETFPRLPHGIEKMWPSCSPDLKGYAAWTRNLVASIAQIVNGFISSRSVEFGSDAQKVRIAGVLRSLFYIYCMQLYTQCEGKPEELRQQHFPPQEFLEDYTKDFLISGLPKFHFYELVQWCSDDERRLLYEVFCKEDSACNKLRLCGELSSVVLNTFGYKHDDSGFKESIEQYIDGVLIRPLKNELRDATKKELTEQTWVCKIAPFSIHPLLEFRAPLYNGCDASGMPRMIQQFSNSLQVIRSGIGCSAAAIVTPSSLLSYISFVAPKSLCDGSFLRLWGAYRASESDTLQLDNCAITSNVRVIAALASFAMSNPQRDVGRLIATARHLITEEVAHHVETDVYLPHNIIDSICNLVDFAVSALGHDLSRLEAIALRLRATRTWKKISERHEKADIDATLALCALSVSSTNPGVVAAPVTPLFMAGLGGRSTASVTSFRIGHDVKPPTAGPTHEKFSL